MSAPGVPASLRFVCSKRLVLTIVRRMWRIITHCIEQQNAHGVVRAYHHLSLLNLHRGLECHQKVARLDVFVSWVVVHFEHGRGAVNAEKYDVPLSLIELPNASGQ